MSKRIRTAITAALLSASAHAALAQTVPIPVEIGPNGQVSVSVGLSNGQPTSMGGGFTNSSGTSGSASVDANGNISLSAGSDGLSGTVTTGPSGTSGGVSYQTGY